MFMSFFNRREGLSHEEQLRQQALESRPIEPEEAASIGSIAVAPYEPYGGAETTEATDTVEDEEDAEFEATIREQVKDIEAMSVEELLADAADDIARSDELDDMDMSMWHITRAAAVSNRAVALLLQQQIELR